MIARALDSLISLVSPKAAVQRAAARKVLSQIERMGYDGAKRDRTNDDWRASNRSADLELLSDADFIRARARDLVRNNAYARGVISAIRRNVIGCGIYPESRSPNEKYNDAVEQEWERWQCHADVTGRLAFYEIEGLCVAEFIEAGECLVHAVRVADPSRPLQFALELIEADRLAGDSVFARGINPDNGNEVRRGVEVDRFGVPVAYHVYERNPNDLNASRLNIRRLDAQDCCHIYRCERIGQTRGISAFAPVVMWLRNIRAYMDAELQSQRVASCFSVFIKTIDGGAAGGLLPTPDGDNDTTDANGNSFEHIEAGLVARGLPGEEVQVINPQRGQSQAQTYVNLILRSIAVGTGISYERLTRDYSQTNYSSNRASDLEDRREFRPLQDMIIRQVCEFVWHKFLAALIDREDEKAQQGLPRMPHIPPVERFVANYDDFTAHVWQAPGWEWVDPLKEASASVLGIEKGLSTYEAECAKRGLYWKDVFRQRKREQDFATQIGLSLSTENVIPIAEAAVAADQQQQQANAQNAPGATAAAG